jgi:putative transcriptional regulator
MAGAATGTDGSERERADPGAIAIRLDKLLSDRGMTLIQLSQRVGITVVNLSILKNGKARAIRYT